MSVIDINKCDRGTDCVGLSPTTHAIRLAAWNCVDLSLWRVMGIPSKEAIF